MSTLLCFFHVPHGFRHEMHVCESFVASTDLKPPYVFLRVNIWYMSRFGAKNLLRVRGIGEYLCDECLYVIGKAYILF